ncbi:MAG: hypothetical protein WBJ84_07505 [Bacteroidales bacterium]
MKNMEESLLAMEFLNCSVHKLDISVRLLNNLLKMNVEVLLDLLTLIYKDDPALGCLGKVSRAEICKLFYQIDPKIIKTLPIEWQHYYSMNTRFIGRSTPDK